MKTLLLFTLFTLSTATVYLKSEDFELKTQGKKAFVAFKAPWCGHCKALKKDWDLLAENMQLMVGEVDCTVEKDLCSKHGVQGYPTIKYSDGYGWTKYEGGRDYSSLESFADDLMEESCLDDIGLCSDEEKQLITDALKLNAQELEIKLEELGVKLKDIEAIFTSEVQALQSTYQKLQQTRDSDSKRVNKERKYLLYAKSIENEEL